MSTSPIIITPSTSVVLVNTADYIGNPVVLLPNLVGPGALGRIITVRDNDGGSVDPAKSIYLSTTGGARFQAELSTVTLSTIRITQPYGFITLTPRLTDPSGNTNYGLMNIYAFPEASPAAYINTFNANFSYLSTLSTANLAVSQDTIIQGNLTVGGGITYVTPGSNTLNINRINANTISVASLLNSNFYGVNAALSTINTSSFIVRDAGTILMPNASSWSNAASFAGATDPNSLTLGNPAASAGAQIGVSSKFFGVRAFTQSAVGSNYSTVVVLRDRNVAINPASMTNIGIDGNNYSNYRLFVNGAVRLSNEGLGLDNDILLRKQTNAYSSIVEVTDFAGSLGTFRIDSSSNITEGFFGSGNFTNQYKWLSVDKAGSIQFWTGSSPSDNTTSRVTIDNTGRMGIGTTAPGNTLDISGELRVSGTSRLGPSVGPTIIGNDANAYMVLGRSRTSPGGSYIDFDISSTSGVGSRIIRYTGTDGDFDIINGGNGNLRFATSNTNRMIIDSNGRIGFGRTPSAPYNVDMSGRLIIRNGTGRVISSDASGNFSVGSSFDNFGAVLEVVNGTLPPNEAPSVNFPHLSLRGGDNTVGKGQLWIDGGYDAQKLNIQSLRATSLTSYSANSLILNPIGGNVGIGTTGPSFNLDVSGSGHITGNLTVDGTISGTLSVVPTGCIMMWYTNTAPTGWLLCDGTAIPGGFTALIALVGANTPNMKGRVPVGRDAAQTEFDTLGETGGAKTHTLTEAEMPTHFHSGFKTQNDGNYKVMGPNTYDNQADGADGSSDVDIYDRNGNTGTLLQNLNIQTNSAGNSSAHNNLQPYIVLNYIIKT